MTWTAPARSQPRTARRDGARPGLRVAVAGAGLGGLCLANGLHRAGADVTVYERDARLASRPQGYRLHLDARAGLALQQCLAPDLLELFLATCGRPGKRFTVVSERLRVLHEVAMEPGRDPSAPATLSVPANRQTLREVLAAGLDGRILFGHELTRYAEGAGGVRLYFGDGRPADADRAAQPGRHRRDVPGADPDVGTSACLAAEPRDPAR